MRYKNIVAALSLTALITSEAECTKKSEQKHNYFLKKDLDDCYNTSYKITTTVKLEKEVNGEDQKSWQGSGTLLQDSQTGNYYLLTAEHITSDGTYKSKSGEVVKIIEEKSAVDNYEAKIFKESEEYDLAFFKLAGFTGKPFTGKIAAEIHPGNYVIGVGYPSGEKELFTTKVTDISRKSTFLDIFIVGGNSGGGVYLIKDKEIQLCGVVTKTDSIPSLERLKIFFKDTPLEDEYL